MLELCRTVKSCLTTYSVSVGGSTVSLFEGALIAETWTSWDNLAALTQLLYFVLLFLGNRE